MFVHSIHGAAAAASLLYLVMAATCFWPASRTRHRMVPARAYARPTSAAKRPKGY